MTQTAYAALLSEALEAAEYAVPLLRECAEHEYAEGNDIFGNCVGNAARMLEAFITNVKEGAA